MNYRTPTTAGLSIGVLGISVTALATILLSVIPDYRWASTATAQTDAILRWSGLVISVGQFVLVFGILLLSAGLAWYLVNDGYSPKRVVRGFVIGGLVFGVGVALLSEAVMFVVDNPALGRSVSDHVSGIVGRGGRVVGGALLGVCCALAVDSH